MTTAAAAPKQLPKRDFLVSLELKAQERWEQEKVFQQDAPLDPAQHEKYMVAFPYPYMNGRLHMGHTFSVSKPEFAVGYQRLKGKIALFPFGFHCTGMPIKAAADKIAREVEMFGPLFEGYKKPEEIVEEIGEELEDLSVNQDPTKKKAKHGKQAAKSTGLNYQFQIMQSMGVALEEIQRFADPSYWIHYWPPIATNDLKRLGAHVDWRRSFITTDANPYYDSFIRWQFNQLHKLVPSKIQFGERYTIYSPLDGQACMDHDRSSGEGVGVQEYTGIKLRVLFKDLEATPVSSRPLVKNGPVAQKLSSPECKAALKGRELFMVCATLRPETMYGQTNCYVGVDLDYGVFAVNDNEAWVCTERAARNMAFQKLFEEKGVVKKLFDLKGWDLVGIPVSAPYSFYEKVYTLPMEGVLATKGTGVVTSVPSDSPDDYVTMLDLSKKAAYYNIQSEWVTPFLPPKPIIQTPQFGNLCAVAAVEKLKINSQKDKKQLAEAKEMVYKEGFYNGTIIVGKYSGKSVQEVKPLIKKDLIDQGLAFPYCEPEGLVVSRSGDECVVTLAAQWYMDYGEESWKAKAIECVNNMQLFSEETKNNFLATLDWMMQWACSRSFGLGSRLPWDKDWLIESLSDSTIYMAYYTVAHILHEGTLDGSKPSKEAILPDQMTDEVWSYIMLEGPLPETTISKEKLDKMRREFEFFYPLDLRTSGKDLISNHLTFFIYNHVAIFPKKNWPQGVRVNGHLLLNNEKMSKSTGNFLTMRDALDRYGADATRFALADAGDGLEDANFLEKTADDAILKLFTEREWLQETFNSASSLRTGTYNWNDLAFDAEMDSLIPRCDEAYSKMLFREAIKIGYYDLQNARNEYRKVSTGQGLPPSAGETFDGMHLELVKKFTRIQALMLAPITPHWCESIWLDILREPKSIMHARWPESKAFDHSLLAAKKYVGDTVSRIRSTEDGLAKKKNKKGGKAAAGPHGPSVLTLFVASKYPKWQEDVIEILKKCYDGANGFRGEKEAIKAVGLEKDKRVMPFLAAVKKNVEIDGGKAFDRALLFNEFDTLQVNLDYLRRDLYHFSVQKVILVRQEDASADDAAKAEIAIPGNPSYILATIS